MPVIGGKIETVTPQADPNVSFIVKKGNQDKVNVATVLDEPLKAPLTKGQKIGTSTLTINGEKVAVCDILASEEIPRMSFGSMFVKLFYRWVCA